MWPAGQEEKRKNGCFGGRFRRGPPTPHTTRPSELPPRGQRTGERRISELPPTTFPFFFPLRVPPSQRILFPMVCGGGMEDPVGLGGGDGCWRTTPPPQGFFLFCFGKIHPVKSCWTTGKTKSPSSQCTTLSHGACVCFQELEAKIREVFFLKKKTFSKKKGWRKKKNVSFFFPRPKEWGVGLGRLGGSPPNPSLQGVCFFFFCCCC